MKRLSSAIIATLAIAIMTGAVYAAATLSISNTVTVVAGAANMFLATANSPTTICSTLPAASYTDIGLALTWGNMVQGTTQDQFACVRNDGAAHVVALTVTGWDAAHGTFTATIGGTPAIGQTINGAGGFVLFDFTLGVSLNAPLGPQPFTVNLV